MSAALDLSERDIERETVPAPVRPAATDAASAGSRSSRKEREDAAAGLRRIDIDIGVDVESGVRPGQVAHAYVEHAGPKRAYMRDIILIGLTSAIAGAISMGLGEYLATRSRTSAMTDGEIKLEKDVRAARPTCASTVRRRSPRNFMMVTEFGQSEDDLRRPWKASWRGGEGGF
eukprot:tig00000704_g3288.t1